MLLPLTNNSEEIFSASVFETVYNFRQLWNDNGFWTLDIRDADDTPIVLGVKLITQERLLRQFPDIVFDLISDNATDPVRDNLDGFSLEVIAKDV